ncbi:serine/threonine-protein kinase RIO2 [Methanopyrus sp. SNP6]|uniref:serine/threonine-protein kinase RIO2 n=1 Tax=Methanopyrus sp. SNP6 TaxID=1937005 RepID=UPI0011E59914|nr:serine/threonine-protein kinase RIO2 [Methanopyrus sp. SNP6]
MVMVERVVQALPGMEPEDFEVLRALEMEMRRHEWVPFDRLLERTGLDEKELGYRLSRLDRWDMVVRTRRQTVGYLGYQLRPEGYDALALRALVDQGVLEGLGPEIGVGKEADVYLGISPKGAQLAVKFNRIGRTSYTKVKRYREYVKDKRHISWLYVNRLTAEREFEALLHLYPDGVSVPRPVAQNRHVLVMERFEGRELAETRVENPEAVLNRVLEEYEHALEVGVVHGDLSQFNVVIEGDEVLLIDWAHWVEVSHPSARELIERDVRNICDYFRRKYGVHRHPREFFWNSG